MEMTSTSNSSPSIWSRTMHDMVYALEDMELGIRVVDAIDHEAIFPIHAISVRVFEARWGKR